MYALKCIKNGIEMRKRFNRFDEMDGSGSSEPFIHNANNCTISAFPVDICHRHIYTHFNVYGM